MDAHDIKPSLGRVTADNQQNRLGCVLEGIDGLFRALPPRCPHEFTLVAFSHETVTVFEALTLDSIDTMVSRMMKLVADGGTDFEKAFSTAELVLKKLNSKRTRIFFLTDGESKSPKEKVKSLVETYPNLSVLTIKFSNSEQNTALLQEIALVGQGVYKTALTPEDFNDIVEQFAIQELL